MFLAVVLLEIVAVLALVSDAVGAGGLAVAAQLAGMAKSAAHGQAVSGAFHGQQRRWKVGGLGVSPVMRLYGFRGALTEVVGVYVNHSLGFRNRDISTLEREDGGYR